MIFKMCTFKNHDNIKYMFKRLCPLPMHPKESFFLWGPRQTGKTSLVHYLYPKVRVVDLLKTDLLIRYSQKPSLFREECLSQPKEKFVVIDEIQKVPMLLDEVHYLIEKYQMVFGLCGSSARKLKKEHANLLGGRALRFELHGLVSAELGVDFDLVKLMNRGYLPKHYLSNSFERLLESYITDYLKEEILDEGLSRNLPVFSDFLRAASFSDGELVNFSNIGSECGVSPPTVREYFQILCDTMIGRFLPAYTRRPKRKIIHGPKFYFFNVGVTNFLAKRKNIVPGSELFGKAFENWVHHELIAYLAYRRIGDQLFYWRLTTGREVDFVIDDLSIAIEAKASHMVRSEHLKGLRDLKADQPLVKKRVVVSLEAFARKTEDGILILPYQDFVTQLWNDALIL